MIGAIIGDIIGSPYEFHGRLKTTEFPLFSERSRPTDDSILTIATADSVMHNTSYPDNYRKYTRSCNAGFAPSFLKWAWSNAGPYGSYGNGSAMRVSPIAWLFNGVTAVKREAELSAKCTHNHPEGIKGAVATALMILSARKEKDKEALKSIMQELEYETEITINEIRPTYEFDPTCPGCLPQAFRCVYEAESYEEAVRLAVSLGGDSDTLACIAGSIAEAMWGIPENIRKEGMDYLAHYNPNLLTVVSEFEGHKLR
jgi:ADP-ribosylglycohydrolase